MERTLRAFAHVNNGGYEFAPKQKHPVLTHQNPADPASAVHDRSVEPDGLLMRNFLPAISFEAKYTASTSLPERAHMFQALTTAAALGTSLAVLVYPGDEPPRIYDVRGFMGAPRHLATIGLSMFTYSRPGGDIDRAGQIAALLDEVARRGGPAHIGTLQGVVSH
ncbi:hypothetical protein ACAG26_04030 [Mycobacterium sp. pUA109]|uniref:hypothetical protein n=1 Tax=Mycobacterium sp. pUA109 TaxID=3238982 RepID=UPI00351AB65C